MLRTAVWVVGALVMVSITTRNSVAVAVLVAFTIAPVAMSSKGAPAVKIDETVKTLKSTEPGSTVIVRQTGSSSQAPAVPLLKVGEQYLLYLTPSGLDGEQAEQFYVTGANAGIYAETSSGDEYRQVQRQEGEDLPLTVTEEEASG